MTLILIPAFHAHSSLENTLIEQMFHKQYVYKFHSQSKNYIPALCLVLALNNHTGHTFQDKRLVKDNRSDCKSNIDEIDLGKLQRKIV